MPDLHLEKFQLQEDGTWLNQRGGSEAIKLLADKVGYKLMLPTERKSYTFDLEGKLISIQRNNQQPVKITYQGKFIQHITLSCGQEIRFAYDNDKISTITDPIGRVLRYTYDGDLLTKVTYPNGGSFQYNYDESGLILSVRDLNGKTYVSTGTDMRHSRPRG